ncbi:MAG TPA: hypothetical protein VGD50_05445 [Candidatus Baltobacteraceae bacterium]
MSFFDSVESVAGELLQGAQAQTAAAPDTATAGSGQAATPNVATMDQGSLVALGTQLLATFTSHGAYNSDGAQAAQEAGTSADAVASGSPDAISTLMTYAKAHPQILQSALSAFGAR